MPDGGGGGGGGAGGFRIFPLLCKESQIASVKVSSFIMMLDIPAYLHLLLHWSSQLCLCYSMMLQSVGE